MLMEEVEMIKQMVMKEPEESDIRVRELVGVVKELRDERGEGDGVCGGVEGRD
jgi:hypothetical protein